LKQLEFITWVKQAGFSLRQIQAFQQGASRGKAAAWLWRDLVVEKAAELDQIFFRVYQAQRPSRSVGALSMPKISPNVSTK
jgi:DNA-binding transcriptional MerR regulator